MNYLCYQTCVLGREKIIVLICSKYLELGTYDWGCMAQALRLIIDSFFENLDSITLLMFIKPVNYAVGFLQHCVSVWKNLWNWRK